MRSPHPTSQTPAPTSPAPTTMPVLTAPARAFLLFAAVSAVAADCGGGETPAPTFTSLRDSLFTPRCGATGCHGDNPARGLDLVNDPHAALVDVASVVDPAKKYVVPGDPEASLLLTILRQDVDGPGGAAEQMPPGFALSQDTVAEVEAWIAAGAPND